MKIMLEKEFHKRYRLWLEMSIASILVISLLGLYIFNVDIKLTKQLILPTLILLIIVASPAILRSSLATIITMLGIICIMGTFLLISYGIDSNHLSKRMISDSIKLFMIGIGTLIISIIMIFKPELLYAKNRPIDIKPKIWSSKSLDKPLVPIKSLLNECESYLVANYSHIIALIDNVTYFVPVDEYVPRSSSIIRRNGYFIGIKKN